MRLYSEGETVDLYLVVRFNRVGLERLEATPPSRRDRLQASRRDRLQMIHDNTKTTPDITIPRHPVQGPPLTNKPLLPLATGTPGTPEVMLVVPRVVN